ncbi:23S rRNA (adenine(2503)-C(2))-methyltransferase RlmN [uncultured Algimonas sp.]|uniref:23S rRNA (adenine(2503)-C(2))-methyltransferase RlmN n=1 Tax=uncultured Algimonas sp. TaxID=1547920 RepID=UPI002637CA08|nr:23S rRNA (adenine(2503)-C(2))-methyltransferase RlmN [uncultured Algimonas sp.]
MPTTLLDTKAATPLAGRTADGRVRLPGLSRAEIAAHLAEMGVEAKKVRMRANQIFNWVYHWGVTDFAAMTNIAKGFRADLEAHFTLARPGVIERQVSRDGTRKYLIRMAPGIEVESVFIPDVSRSGALCVSSQVGCTLTCTFCHTGTQRLVRNLTPAEIVLQVMACRDDLGEWPAAKGREGTDVTEWRHGGDRKLVNIVFMGMGEPLYNTDNVIESIDLISDDQGLSIGRRRITVSTSGVVPDIAKVGAANPMLAISLHAADDETRTRIMPINKKYPLDDLLQACRDYPGLSNARRITFEYVMLKGVNDTPQHARNLITKLQGIPAKVNLIPFNPWPGSPYECSDMDVIEDFARRLKKAGLAAPVRKTRGEDIMAACGQLKSESEKQRASVLRKAAKAAP